MRPILGGSSYEALSFCSSWGNKGGGVASPQASWINIPVLVFVPFEQPPALPCYGRWLPVAYTVTVARGAFATLGSKWQK